ncbi:actin-related protein 4-like isoform X2 [Oryza glaberrima]|uniref:actin-related protein 4-like isoform X2 n=1 Tax=Oryza glaberrima TaxID=4538 RepID=UPI00224BFDC7|nr:actin-related protein 4-like isoform X2 [Oryza glaberrima]
MDNQRSSTLQISAITLYVLKCVFILFRRDHMEVISPMKDGTFIDWDIVDNIWNHAFRLYKVALRLPCSDSSAGPVIYIMHWTIEPGCFWRTREHGWSII